MHLICGLNESPAALAAACLGAAIARRLDVELTLVHAVQPPGGGALRGPAPLHGDAAGALFAERTSAAIDGQAELAESLASLTGARVVLRVEAGEPSAVLRTVVADAGCDLLLLGRRKRSPLLDAFVPGVARRLAAAPPCPLALVPEDASARLPRQIVVGCHGETASQAATAIAGRLAALLDARLSLVHAAVTERLLERPTGWQRYDAPRRHRRVARSAAGRPLDVELLERPGRASATLAGVCDEDRSAWVAVGEPARGRRGARGTLPAGCRIADATGVPVIVVPDVRGA